MNIKSKESKVWILYTILFVLATILLITLIIWNSFLGFVCLIMFFLTFLVGGVFKALFNKNDGGKRTIVLLDIEELNGSQRILRYATAILAFLSLLTTANGMKSFVFSESWMAYTASFAVQSILVIFSLLLCRFFVQVTDLNWPLYIKRIVNDIMILFFCIALLVSSIFSFSFISNNAYRNSWSSDSETIIQEFLLREIDSLKIENERRGKLIIATINEGIREKIKGIIEETRINNIDSLQKDVIDLVGKFPVETLKKGKVDINKRELLEIYPQYEIDVNLLCEHYKIYSDLYDQAVVLHNKIIKEVKNWNETTKNEDMYNLSEQWFDDIGSMRTDLKNSKKNIKNLKTYRFDVDFSAVRSRYIQETDVLLSKLLDIRKNLKNINEIFSQIKGSSDATRNDELDEILSQIYLLDITEPADTAEPSNITDLINKISNLAVSFSAADNSNSETIENIVSIKNELSDYSDHLTLKRKISEFEKKNVRKTYIIILNNKKKINKKNNEIGYTAWRNQRNKDFTTFCTYVKSLPDISNYDQENSEGHMDEYKADNVLDIATTYQRDLLGDLTEFEKAFNYFKYKYPVMAYFSAFIAIFFDLGSFFTGCFLYATEYFETKSTKEEKGDNKK